MKVIEFILQDVRGDILDEILPELATELEVGLKKQLLVPVSRKGVISRWKNGRPIKVGITYHSAPLESSGRLRNSINSEVDDAAETVIVSMESYGSQLDEGRSIGNWPNVRAIERWIRMKPVSSTIKTETLAYLIGRKIRWYGIEATGWIEKGINLATTT